jgi:hypothetical protein
VRMLASCQARRHADHPGRGQNARSPWNAGLQESGGPADTSRDCHSPWSTYPESGCNLRWRSNLDRVQQVQPTARGRRLLVRLGLLAFCAGLLLLLSSRPADAAERREPQLLDPVGTTLKATAREVDSFAGRATGSGAFTVARTVDAARQVVAPPARPAPGAARPPVTSTVKRGGPAVTSPVRRVAPPTSQLTSPTRPATRPAKPATATPVQGSEHRAGSLEGGRILAPVSGLISPVLGPLDPVLGPLGPVLGPVGSALAPIIGPVGGLAGPVLPGGLLPLPGLVGSGTGSRAGPAAGTPAVPFTGFEGTGSAAGVASASPSYPVRLAADGASSPATRSIRSWPALTGAVSLPGFPTSAELPAGGPDPLSTSSGAGLALPALAAVLLLLGPLGRGRARPDRSGLISRSYLPLVSPA